MVFDGFQCYWCCLLHFRFLFLCHHKSKVRNHIIHNPFLSGFHLYYHIKYFSTTVIQVNTSECRISVLTLFDLEQHPEQWPYFFPLEIWLQWHHTHCFIANSESPRGSLYYPSIKCLKAQSSSGGLDCSIFILNPSYPTLASFPLTLNLTMTLDLVNGILEGMTQMEALRGCSLILMHKRICPG